MLASIGWLGCYEVVVVVVVVVVVFGGGLDFHCSLCLCCMARTCHVGLESYGGGCDLEWLLYSTSSYVYCV